MSPTDPPTKPDRLMLDEMFSPRIGQLLSDSGIDCICVADDRMLCTQNDATIFTAALGQARVLVTNNILDFEPLRRARSADGDPVPPLIYTDGPPSQETQLHVAPFFGSWHQQMIADGG